MGLLKSTSLVGEMADEVAACLARYRQLAPGANIAVALSGGKDSWCALALLAYLQAEGRLPHELSAIHIGLGFAGENERLAALQTGCDQANVPLRIVRTTIGPDSLAAGKKRPCFLCARARREAIFREAAAFGADHIATGHHRDDVLACFVLNLAENRELSAMVPRQSVFNGKMHLIRPLFDMPEARIVKLIKQQDIPVTPSGCPMPGQTNRARAEALLALWEKQFPEIRQAMFTALHRLKPEFLPGDESLS